MRWTKLDLESHLDLQRTCVIACAGIFTCTWEHVLLHAVSRLSFQLTVWLVFDAEDPPSPRKAVGKIASVPNGVLLPRYQWIRDKTEGGGDDEAKDEGEVGRPKAGEGGSAKGIWSRLVRYSKKWLLTTLPREAKGQGGNNLQLIETNKETRDQRRLRERNTAREIQVRPESQILDTKSLNLDDSLLIFKLIVLMLLLLLLSLLLFERQWL